ncbi:helix-turn-helix transcriptional regulator [Amnibacterium kyonggiense]
MKRAERMYALVDLLRAARSPLSAARLAREFDVSKRTIERDIQSLQLADVPIYADQGVSGGYSILREYSLPPLNLTPTEALAVLAGLGMLDSSPYRTAARTARAKVSAVVADEGRGRLQEALASIRIVDQTLPSERQVPLEVLAEAADARRVVRLTYRSSDLTEETVRDVETMGLLRGGDSWMLVGWCRLRSGIRGFHIHRIAELTITDETAPRRDPALLEADLARWSVRDLAG